jgi:hypothetical protein
MADGFTSYVDPELPNVTDRAAPTSIGVIPGQPC